MTHPSNFNLDETLLLLSPFIENHAEGSKEKEALKLAQAALLYIRDNKKEEAFARYFESFSNTSFTVEVSHEFATREEADTWLSLGKAKHTERVKIAGKGFMVVQMPRKQVFMVAPLPEELASDEWKDEPE